MLIFIFKIDQAGVDRNLILYIIYFLSKYLHQPQKIIKEMSNKCLIMSYTCMCINQ